MGCKLVDEDYVVNKVQQMRYCICTAYLHVQHFMCTCPHTSLTLIQASSTVVKTSLSTSLNEFASLLGGILKMSILPSGRGAGVAAICE